MRVSPAGDDSEALVGERFRQHFGIRNNLTRIISELLLQRLAEADSLGRDDVHQRSALHPGENNFVYGSREFLFRENHSCARSAKSLMGRGGDNLRVWHR